MKLLFQIFEAMEKIWISCVDKTLLSDEKKMLFKQSNGLISVIRTLRRLKQWLEGGMLTLNAVEQTQMMLNAQVSRILQLSRKTPQTPQTRSANRKFKSRKIAGSWRYHNAVYSPFCMNICEWESCVGSRCRVCSQSIKNNNASKIQSVVCYCFNATKNKFLRKCVTIDETLIYHLTPKFKSAVSCVDNSR